MLMAHRVDHVDDNNAQQRTHEVVLIEEDCDRGIDAQLGECVGQQG